MSLCVISLLEHFVVKHGLDIHTIEFVNQEVVMVLLHHMICKLWMSTGPVVVGVHGWTVGLDVHCIESFFPRTILEQHNTLNDGEDVNVNHHGFGSATQKLFTV